VKIGLPISLIIMRYFNKFLIYSLGFENRGCAWGGNPSNSRGAFNRPKNIEFAARSKKGDGNIIVMQQCMPRSVSKPVGPRGHFSETDRGSQQSVSSLATIHHDQVGSTKWMSPGLKTALFMYSNASAQLETISSPAHPE
jgi:hypothetical protein